MELERDNRLLVSRIARTMGTKGGLDNWNKYQPKPRWEHVTLGYLCPHYEWESYLSEPYLCIESMFCETVNI